MSTDLQPSYLDPHVLATLGSLEMRARLMMEGIMTGMHQSPYRGASVEFAQHRPYVPGDDLRHLDWKVFARTDKLYLKQHQRETNLDLVVLADASGSMAYSSAVSGAGRGGKGTTRAWRKYDHAACLTAAMALLALRQQDRVGVLVFDREVVGSSAPSSADDQWRTVVKVLEAHQPTGTAEPRTSNISSGPSAAGNPRTSNPPQAGPSGGGASGGSGGSGAGGSGGSGGALRRMFEQATTMTTRRSLMVLMSDLFDDVAAIERGLALVRHRGHDLMILQTLDPAELDFGFRSPTRFVGLEADGLLNVDPAAIRKAYLESIGQHLDRVAKLARRFQFDYQRVDTSHAMGPTLSHFLARRAASIRQRS